MCGGVQTDVDTSVEGAGQGDLGFGDGGRQELVAQSTADRGRSSDTTIDAVDIRLVTRLSSTLPCGGIRFDRVDEVGVFVAPW
jgi:hypothetical protein